MPKPRSTNRSSDMARNGNGKSPLSANTTIQLGLAVVILGATFSGAWWASSLSIKVDSITNASHKLENDMSNVKKDVGDIKYEVRQVQNSVNQISTETIKKR